MRELDCDFCGDRAAGAYEVVPAELNPSPAEQVRVVLCGNCRDTLDAVTAPLLARLGVDGGGTTESESDSQQSTLQSETTDGTDTDGTDTDGNDADDRGPEDGAQASARAENPVSPADDAVIIDSGPRPDKGRNGSAGGTAAAAADATDVPDADGADGAGSAADDDAGGGADADDANGGGGGGDGEDDDGGKADAPDAVSAAAAEETVRERAREPEDFRTVMRLLNNREFPVDRAEITDLASGAYELEVSQVDEIIDYAIERDVLAEENGKLTKA